MPEYLAGAEPFYFDGNSTGCLLIHGFGGTPYEMRGLGSYLSKEYGCAVSGPALAGHATHVQEMARTTWPDWYGSVEAAYRDLASRCERVVAIGLSLGGALALHLAAHRPLTGVVAVSAPVYIKHPLLFWFRSFPFLFRFLPYVKPGDDDTQDPTVRPQHPTYDRTPTGAARSLITELLPLVRSELAAITTPALLLQSRGDRTIPPDSMPLIHAALGSHDKEMVWLARGGHLVLEDYDKEHAFQLISGFVARHAGQAVNPSARATI